MTTSARRRPGPLSAGLVALAALGSGCAMTQVADEQAAAPPGDEAGAAGGAAPAPTPAHGPAPARPEVAPVEPGAPPPPAEEPWTANPWPERAQGPAGPTASPAAGVRFAPPSREPRAPRGALPDRPRLGVVVVRGGVIVHAPQVLLDLEARLDGAVAAVLAVEPGARASVGVEDLADLARARGLDLLLVDGRAASAAGDPAGDLGAGGARGGDPGGDGAVGGARDGWLVVTATRELIARLRDPRASSAPPAEAALAARIERAWLALP